MGDVNDAASATLSEKSEGHNSKASSDAIRESSGQDVERPPQDGASNATGEKQIEVTWDGEHDPDDPRHMSMARRWLIVLVIASTSYCVTFNSSIYIFISDPIIDEWGTSREVVTLGLSTFVIGLGLSPMILSPLSEFYGRRNIYLVALFFVFIFIIPCAVAQNIQTLIITRFFDGLAASVFLSVAGGTVRDMFHAKDLSLPMMVYSGSPFLGPASGPIIGGFINQYSNWQTTFWVLLGWTGVQFFLILAFIPETYHPVLLRRKAQRLRKETGNDAYYAPIEVMEKSIPMTILWSFLRPFQLLFLEPMVLNLCVLSALLLGTLYLFFGAFPLIFENNHDFTLSQVGLSFLGLFIGMLIAIASDVFWSRNYRRLVQKREAATGEMGVSEPEYRLPPTIFGAQMVWIGLFGFAWTTYSTVHWAVPIFFSGFVGLGIVTSFAGVYTFLVESYPIYSASTLAANSFVRSIFAAVFPLFGRQMYEKLGYQWASTLLAFLTLALAPFPYIFFRYGKRIRAHSKFASAQ